MRPHGTRLTFEHKVFVKTCNRWLAVCMLSFLLQFGVCLSFRAGSLSGRGNELCRLQHSRLRWMGPVAALAALKAAGAVQEEGQTRCGMIRARSEGGKVSRATSLAFEAKGQHVPKLPCMFSYTPKFYATA